MTGERVERRLAAVLAADVVGYSRLMGFDEEGTLARLKALRKALADPAIASHHGRIVKTTGDGMLVEFASAVDAVRCAVEVQRSMAAQNADVPQDVRIEFRIGIHVGDIIIDDNDIFGDGVNIAARLEGIAEPGGVCISDDAQRHIRGKVDMTFEDMGPQNLKNIVEPMRAWRGLPNGYAFTTTAKPSAAFSLPVLPDKPSIAVLPFLNMSGAPEQEYFADGVVEDIITALSRFKSLFVIARNSSFTYKGSAIDIKQVGRELGVRYVLEGSVRKSAARLRITGQLIDIATNAHLWADKFDGALEDVFDLQDSVTTSVVGAIAPRLAQAEIERAKRKPTESLDSYDLYLQGMASINRLEYGKASEIFERAIEKDPEHAEAQAMAASALSGRQYAQGVTLSVEERTRALEFAWRAAAIGSDDAFCLARAAHTLVYLGKEYDVGSALIEQAIALNPNLSLAWHMRGWISVMNCDVERAIDSFSKATRFSPIDPQRTTSWNGLSWAYFIGCNYDEGCRWATRALQHSSNAILLGAFIANAIHAGRSSEAQEAVVRLREAAPAFRASHASNAFPVRKPEVRTKIQDALCQAGVPA